MKSLIALLAVLAIVSAQTPRPVPIPNLNLNSFNGQWYVAAVYNSNINNNAANPWNCESAVITTNSNGGTLQLTLSYGSYNETDSSFFSLVNGNVNQWNIGDSDWDWVAFDPISSSWATLANADSQSAILFSRSPTVSSLILTAQKTLLNGEGYNWNSTNYYTFSNTNC